MPKLSTLLELAKCIGIILGIAAFAWVTYRDKRERAMAKKHKMSPNPTRCGEMAARVEALEKDIDTLGKNNREDHGKLFQQIGALAVEVARIGRNGGPK